jgi:hypothetical protein
MLPIIISAAGDFDAAVCPQGAVFSAHVEALPDRHHTKRFVALMCLYADDVRTGQRPGPYSDAAAAAWARREALPADAYREAIAAGASVESIADRLCLPTAQVQLRALDPDTAARRRGAVRCTLTPAPATRHLTVYRGGTRVSAKPLR